MDITSLAIGIGIIFGGIVLALLLYALYTKFLKQALVTESKLDDVILAAFGKPLVILVIAVSIYIGVRYFMEIPEEYQWIFEGKCVMAFIVFVATWITSVFVNELIRHYGKTISEKTQTDFDDHIVAVLERSAKYVIWFIGILIILAMLSVNITPLLAGAGIASLAIALAAQDLLSNILAGTMIMVDQPLKLHDRIRIDEFFGDVVNIGPRSTRIMTVDYQLVTIPNNKITSSIIVNYAMPDIKMLVVLDFPVAYGSDVEKVMGVLRGVVNQAAREIDFILEQPAPIVLFWEFGDSSLNFRMKVWTNDCKKEIYVRSHINREVNRRFIEENITIPFPQVDVHMKED
jgi:MscS family membrane protein